MHELTPMEALSDYYWGACDACGCPGTMLHVWVDGTAHTFMACHDCKTAWSLGTVMSPPDEWWDVPEEALAAAARRFFAEYRPILGKVPAWAEERLRREGIWGVGYRKAKMRSKSDGR